MSARRQGCKGGGGLPQHPPHFASGLHRVEARDALPVLASGGRADFQVSRHVIAALVLGEVGLASCVSTSEAAVANALGCQNLFAVVVLWLGNKDIFKGLRPRLWLLDGLGHLAALRFTSCKPLDHERLASSLTTTPWSNGKRVIAELWACRR